MGVTEADVKSLEEMAAYLEHGSLCRATGSTNMNSHSRSSLAFKYLVNVRSRLVECINFLIVTARSYIAPRSKFLEFSFEEILIS